MAAPGDPRKTVKFWEGKIYKPKRKNARGDVVVSRNFYARFVHEKKTVTLCLQTDNASEAAQKARDAYVLLKSEGRDAMFETYGVKNSLDMLRDFIRCTILPALGISNDDGTEFFREEGESAVGEDVKRRYDGAGEHADGKNR